MHQSGDSTRFGENNEQIDAMLLRCQSAAVYGWLEGIKTMEAFDAVVDEIPIDLFTATDILRFQGSLYLY